MCIHFCSLVQAYMKMRLVMISFMQLNQALSNHCEKHFLGNTYVYVCPIDFYPHHFLPTATALKFWHTICPITILIIGQQFRVCSFFSNISLCKWKNKRRNAHDPNMQDVTLISPVPLLSAYLFVSFDTLFRSRSKKNRIII